MCGIVGAVAQRDVSEILLEGLQRLEYRGYDSAGIAVISNKNLQRFRRLGKVKVLANVVAERKVIGGTGIAHTRWATHGEPSEVNAHPHFSNEKIAVVHNGIIENHEALKTQLKSDGYVFSSETDTEVIAHLIDSKLKTCDSLLAATKIVCQELEGAYGMVVIDRDNQDELIVARSGSPLVIGLGIGENFVASDQLALLPVTRKFMYLEEGDIARVTRRTVEVYDQNDVLIERDTQDSTANYDSGDKGIYRHFMLKEIFEQPTAVSNTLEGRISNGKVYFETFGSDAKPILSQVEHVQIVACGTSYHSGMVAKYWFESISDISCDIEIASEFRYRKSKVRKNSLLVTISQSGETADTLAALRLSKEIGYLASLSICNVAGSSLVRESNLNLLTRAGTEIGVASTKAFTTQLVSLALLVLALGENHIEEEQRKKLIDELSKVPSLIEEVLTLDQDIKILAEEFSEKHHALFLGRGDQYPIAMEGALKLKEISYIHAEAYAAGELKHGPLALIDAEMPIIVVAPNNELISKLKSNIEEVRARGGILYVFADEKTDFSSDDTMKVIRLPTVESWAAPIIYSVPLQLLSYHVAIIKGTDVDQPRNLAKSVTVE